MNKQELIQHIIFLVSVILIVGCSIFIVFNQMSEQTQNVSNFCDEKYGENNWEMVEKETRDTFQEKIYIGQIWECRRKR